MTPVKNPVTDFPITANQPEAYEFYMVVNNGEPITDPECCGDNYDPSTLYAYKKQWEENTARGFAIFTDYYFNWGARWGECGDEWPDQYCGTWLNSDIFPDGEYIGVLLNYRGGHGWYPPYVEETSYTIFEFTIDLE